MAFAYIPVIKAARLGAQTTEHALPVGTRPLPVRLVALTQYQPGAHWQSEVLSPGQAVLNPAGTWHEGAASPLDTRQKMLTPGPVRCRCPRPHLARLSANPSFRLDTSTLLLLGDRGELTEGGHMTFLQFIEFRGDKTEFDRLLERYRELMGSETTARRTWLLSDRDQPGSGLRVGRIIRNPARRVKDNAPYLKTTA